MTDFVSRILCPEKLGGFSIGGFEWRSQTRLLDEVAEALRERIYAGVYAPGAILRQEHIAAEFGISRTPLREALRVLERDGLVIHLPGRGCVSLLPISLA